MLFQLLYWMHQANCSASCVAKEGIGAGKNNICHHARVKFLDPNRSFIILRINLTVTLT